MNFDSFPEFLAMGGYGPYVWSAYAITLVVLAYNVLRPITVRKKVIRDLKRVLEQEYG